MGRAFIGLRNHRKQTKGTNNYTAGKSGYRHTGYGNRERGETHEGTVVGLREATGAEIGQTGNRQILQASLDPRGGLEEKGISGRKNQCGGCRSQYGGCHNLLIQILSPVEPRQFSLRTMR